MKKLIVCVLGVALAACARPNPIQVAFEEERYLDGCTMAQNRAAQSAYASYVAGLCHTDPPVGFISNLQRAMDYFTYAARWDHQEAKNQLLKYGRPIPAPDLAIAAAQRKALKEQAEAASAARTQSIINSFSPSPSSYQPRLQSNCYSNVIGNQVFTNCN